METRFLENNLDVSQSPKYTITTKFRIKVP